MSEGKTLYKVIDDHNDNCFVIPTMYKDDFLKNPYYRFIQENNLGDIILIQDHSKQFWFSKSMNMGIQEALKEEYKIITLSVDSISFSQPQKIFEIYNNLKQLQTDNFVYAPKVLNNHINSHINRSGITNSGIKYLFFQTTLNVLPIYAFKKWNEYRKRRLLPFFVYRDEKNGFLNIMPFGIFSRHILENYQFDEKIKNSFEDSDLAYRLYRDNIVVKEIDVEVIHRGSSFSKINKVNSLSGAYDVQDYCNNINYLYRKYYSVLEGS